MCQLHFEDNLQAPTRQQQHFEDYLQAATLAPPTAVPLDATQATTSEVIYRYRKRQQ